MMLDWLVIGGGIHGMAISRFLAAAKMADGETLRILDPHPAPLHQWSRHAEACGMRYLRSPSVHHLEVDPYALDRFAQDFPWDSASDPPFRSPADRPAFRLFQAHCRHVIDAHDLESFWRRGRAMALRRDAGVIRVETDIGEIRTRNVVLAMGMGDRAIRPTWARKLQDAGAPVCHVFDPSFRREAIPKDLPALVVGAGLTGAQLALALAEEGVEAVTLVSQKQLAISPFDFDPCWLGPKCRGRRAGESSGAWERRIEAARKPGTITPELLESLREQMGKGRLRLRVGEVAGGECRDSTVILNGAFAEATAEGTGSEAKECRGLAGGAAILATGFEPRIVAGPFLETALAEFDLKVTPAGRPDLSGDLRWAPGIWTAGALAEMVLGPPARNIIGARHAARAIVAAVESERRTPQAHGIRKPGESAPAGLTAAGAN